MKKITLVFLATFLVLLISAGCASSAPQATPAVTAAPAATAAAQESPGETGAPAASEPTRASFGKFTAEDINGNSFTQDMFADYDLTMINIWGTFCPPCIDEMPHLGELAAEYKDKGVQIVGIVADIMGQDQETLDPQIAFAKEIVEKTNANYTHLLPSNDLIMIKLQYVTAVPETVFVDKNGNIVGDSVVGSRSKDDWKAIIDNYLEEVK